MVHIYDRFIYCVRICSIHIDQEYDKMARLASRQFGFRKNYPYEVPTTSIERQIQRMQACEGCSCSVDVRNVAAVLSPWKQLEMCSIDSHCLCFVASSTRLKEPKTLKSAQCSHPTYMYRHNAYEHIYIYIRTENTIERERERLLFYIHSFLASRTC